MLESTFLTRKTTYRRYELESRRSHVVLLFEIMAVRLQPTPKKRTEIQDNFMQCARGAHEALVSFTETLLKTTQQQRMHDIVKAAAAEPELRSRLADGFG